jgi:transglutaminase-like putative cysteine protease
MRAKQRSSFSIFLILIGIACSPIRITSAQATVASFPKVTVENQREYHVRQEITLVNEGPGQPEKQNLWVALIHDMPPYQQVKSMTVSPQNYRPVTDEYANEYAEFDFSRQPAGSTTVVQIDYQVVVKELAFDISVCDGQLPDEYIQPELHIESANPQIVDLANDLSQGKGTVCQKVRVFYDYIGSTLVYTFNGQNWGAQAALGSMGADCTEYASLLVALSRSQRIPARYYEGLLYLANQTKNLARQEHTWADAYMPGIGWVALDPTLGRSLTDRNTYFAHYTPDHIIVTTGVNPSTLRGSDYWTHLYWPGNSTRIQAVGKWEIEPAADKSG